MLTIQHNKNKKKKKKNITDTLSDFFQFFLFFDVNHQQNGFYVTLQKKKKEVRKHTRLCLFSPLLCSV